MLRLSPNVGDETVYVGLKGFSRYSDSKALSIGEIKELCNCKRVFVALNRVLDPERIKKVVEELDCCEGFIINDLGTIWKIRKNKKLKSKIASSVGLNPLNNLDIKFFEETGVDIVVIPPEINDELDSLHTSIEIEAFEFALIEMFYKGKCLLSSYFDGVSVKRSGKCTKKCCKRWDVIVNGKTINSKSFRPKAVRFDVKKADLLKIEGRQFIGNLNSINDINESK